MQHIPIQTIPLFPQLDNLLLKLLRSLSAEQWHLPTIAKLWTVKDVTAHLLDGNLKGLSTSRDQFFGEPSGKIQSNEELVSFINSMNARWVQAAKRLSPDVLISLLEHTGKQYTDHLATLEPFTNAIFPVSWSGQSESPNWLHIAREYTEKFLHQQQIRDAVGIPGLMTRELYFPFIATFMYALPYTFKDVRSATGTKVSVRITTDVGGTWCICKNESGWDFCDTGDQYHSRVTIDPDIAWKLFSRSWSADQVLRKIDFEGDTELGRNVLNMVSVVA